MSFEELRKQEARRPPDFRGGAPATPEARRKALQRRNKVIKEARAKAHAKFVAKLRAEHDRRIKEAQKKNQMKIAALLKKNRIKRGKHKPFAPNIFGKKVSKDLAKAGKQIGKSADKFNNRVLKPAGKDAEKALNWTIDHTDEISEGMNITGKILVVVGTGIGVSTGVETAGVGAVIGGALAGLGKGLQETAPLVKEAGEKARKIRDIAQKINELRNMIKEGKSARDSMEKAADILDEAGKVNNDKEFSDAAKQIRRSIKLIDSAILHGKLMIEAVKKGE